MKTIFNLLLFLVAFIVGLLLVISFKISPFIIWIIFIELIVGIVVFGAIKIFLQSSDTDEKKDFKFTDDKRFKDKKEK